MDAVSPPDVTADRSLPGRGGSELLEPPPLGLRHNLARFSLLVVQVAFVGAMVGVERTVLPLLAKSQFDLASKTAALSFILAFGLAKAPGNLIAGRLADRYGRRSVLIAGWLVGLPAPLLIAFAPAWSWVIAANVLLGLQQALCWSTSIFMKVDVAGRRRRGTAIGINESAGYGGTALAAYATGVIAASSGASVAPFFLGEALAIAGLLTAFLFIGETSFFVDDDAGAPPPRHRRSAFAGLCQAGLVTKLGDVAAWGLLPIYFAGKGLPLSMVAVLAAAYPAAWALLQPFAGAVSDAVGRRAPIVAGMLLQAVGLAAIASAQMFGPWLVGVLLLGVGTALVYPVLLAAAGDVAPASARASSIGNYRLWRDFGFVAGALLVGVLADQLGTPRALLSLASLALASSVVVALSLSQPRSAPLPVQP